MRTIKKAIYFLGLNLFRLVQKSLDWLIYITPSQEKEEVKNKKKLAIIQFNAIGDFVLFTGILPYFRELYPPPEWEITLLGSQEYTDIAKFIKTGVVANNSVYDHLILFNRISFIKNLFYRYKLQREIQKLSFDVIICPTYSRNKHMDQLVKIIDSPCKIAFDGQYNRNSAYDLLEKQKNNQRIYTKLITIGDNWQPEHQINTYFIRELGFHKLVSSIPNWQVPKKLINSFLESREIQDDYILVCPGTAAPHRIWPPDKLAEVIDYVWNVYKIPILIAGSSNDKNLYLEIHRHLKEAKVRSLCGETNLTEFVYLIAASKLNIVMDSGPVHLSVAVNSPVVCIIGGGHYKRFFPYGDPQRFRAATKELDCFYCSWNCKFDVPFCVKDIPVTAVIKEVDFLLSKSPES